jgi:hypothetical protein
MWSWKMQTMAGMDTGFAPGQLGKEGESIMIYGRRWRVCSQGLVRKKLRRHGD